MLTEDRKRVLIDIPSADVLLGNDSVRIGIITIKGPAFGWQQFPMNYPDYLLITLPGKRYIPIVLDQDNVGRITRQTVFRVGRNKYAVKYFDVDKREIIITQLDRDVDLPLTAELDLTYKQVQVKTVDDEEMYLKRNKGKELIIYFSAVGFGLEEELREIDSLYQALPAGRRDKVDIAVVSRHRTVQSVENFQEATRVDLPVYLSTSKTCLRLNCRPQLPYFVGVNERGRITTYYGRHEELVKRLGGKVEGRATSMIIN